MLSYIVPARPAFSFWQDHKNNEIDLLMEEHFLMSNDHQGMSNVQVGWRLGKGEHFLMSNEQQGMSNVQVVQRLGWRGVF